MTKSSDTERAEWSRWPSCRSGLANFWKWAATSESGGGGVEYVPRCEMMTKSCPKHNPTHRTAPTSESCGKFPVHATVFLVCGQAKSTPAGFLHKSHRVKN
jgi:hypothetical protein